MLFIVPKAATTGRFYKRGRVLWLTYPKTATGVWWLRSLMIMVSRGGLEPPCVVCLCV